MKIYHMKCKKGAIGRSRERSTEQQGEEQGEAKKTCEESLMGRTEQKNLAQTRKTKSSMTN
jgi:hypothetical protein